MDDRTLQFYKLNARQLAEQYASVASPVAKYFPFAFEPGSRILEVGCGIGREVKALTDEGYDAAGVDASEAMLNEAKRLHPDLAARFIHDSLPNLSKVGDGKPVDGILCCAVLMHLPEELIFDTIFNLRRLLKEGGRLLVSTPVIESSVPSGAERDENGRLFNRITPENFRFLFERVGFRLVERWDSEDSLGRGNRQWATQLFDLQSHGSRSLDRIEAILNRDKKDATYKPALFRALAELATTTRHAAAWLPEGRVAVPITLIADKWLEYFWPLFESSTFIPQKRGEHPGCLKPVAFRAKLEELISFYRRNGGLTRFTLDYRNGTLPEPARRMHRGVHGRLCDTIRSGPVYFAGGGGSGTFRYDPRSRSVLMDADLWHELSLMGAWISDATVLRWAELTAKISDGGLKPSQVIDQLLAIPIPEREVDAARTVYAAIPDKVCVWTGSRLGAAFDVDHAIPFALWRNNDLWNLFPASPAANNDKRDRLPTLPFLQSRKECIVHYWRLMRQLHPARFAFEAEKLSGSDFVRTGNWENRLFSVVSEAVEFTATQRGIPRWEPRLKRLDKRRSHQPEPRESYEIVRSPPQIVRFVDFVPFFDVQAAAGGFGPDQPGIDPATHDAWIRVHDVRLARDMFAIRVSGRSMEPKIPDGSICLFRGGEALAGTRQGRIMLVVLRDSVDPETGGRLTVKRYESQKVDDGDGGFRHTRITLRPINPEYQPIELFESEEGSVRVVGEFISVI